MIEHAKRSRYAPHHDRAVHDFAAPRQGSPRLRRTTTGHDRAQQGTTGQPAAITAATIPLVLLPVELVLDHASEVGIIHTPPWDHCWVCP